MGITSYDVFVSYNSIDRDDARKIVSVLQRVGLTVWFDQDELRPGQTWQDELDRNISKSLSVVILIGPSGIAPWQVPEVRAALSKYMQEGNPVIPVILPGVDKIQLPPFLEQHAWVDCRTQQISQESLERLVWGITGRQMTHYVSQLGDEFIMKLKTGQGREKSLKLYTLPNPRVDRHIDVNWETFGKGIEILLEQIKGSGSHISVDACFGINDAGLVMATFINTAVCGRAKLGYIKCKKIRGKRPVISEDSLFPPLGSDPTIMIFDFEIKHAQVLSLIINELKQRYENPCFYFAVFGAMTEEHDLKISSSDLLASVDSLKTLEIEDLFIAATMHLPGIEPPLRLP